MVVSSFFIVFPRPSIYLMVLFSSFAKAAAEEQVDKVKLAGRRRLCKLATTTTATQQVDEEEAE
jgi:hypothetical protein